MRRFPLETTTLYAELMERLAIREAHRSIGNVPGSFVHKTVKGTVYSYFQFSLPGGEKKQVYLGSRTPALERLEKRYLAGRHALQEGEEGISRLCAQLRAGGALVTDPASARVLSALADEGVFRLAGVLIGTHAFSVLGNLLGVVWEGAALRTQDLDNAGPRVMGIALEGGQADLPGALERLEMGFLPVPSLDPRSPSTSYSVRGKGLRVDILTPEAPGRKGNGAVGIPRFGAAAQPLRFLDFLIQEPVPGAVVNGGGILVNVPSPARFALHKLLVARERPPAFHVKAEKDLRQAGAILTVLGQDRPGDLSLAWKDLKGRGAGWVKRIQESHSHLARLDEDGGRILGDFL